ncbi:MAG: PHP domain-containing protein [Clostridiales bacterium]|nr:PHP domain-containing protein [Clostridiales bacterium]
MIDLHIHTTASDGSLTPEQVVLAAAKIKLKAMAITDHDTINGVAEGLATGEQHGIVVVPGVEFGADYKGKETHILGYFSKENYRRIKKYFDWILEKRHKRNRMMISNLNKAGYEITVEEMYKKASGGTPGRPHLAKCLIEKGYAANVNETFNKILLRKDIYVPREKTSPESVISEILDKKGVPVLAHPVYLDKEGMFETAIEEFMELGLAGIEVIHSDHSEADSRKYMNFAKNNNLIMTGGSDFHGANKDNAFIGKPYVDDKFFKELNRRL